MKVTPLIGGAWKLIRKIESGQASEADFIECKNASDAIQAALLSDDYEDCFPLTTKLLGKQIVELLQLHSK